MHRRYLRGGDPTEGDVEEQQEDATEETTEEEPPAEEETPAET